MERLRLGELDARADELDGVAQAAADVDQFCSSSSWIVPAAEQLMPAGEPWLFTGAGGFVAATVRQRGGVRSLEALEAAWGLACPLVPRDPVVLAREAVEQARADQDEWDVLLWSGLPIRSVLLDEVAAALARHYRLATGSVTRRHIASLEGGLDGFLSRRPSSLRKSLRKAARRARAAGIAFQPAVAADDAAADRLFERILAVERRSWKGQGDVGLDCDGMREFYGDMLRRLARSGRLRCHVARRDDEDVAYIFGAVFGATYRGLQFSFDDRFRTCGLGNLAQVEQVVALAAEPEVTRYDLGTGGDYKIAWAEQELDTGILIAGPG